MCKRRGRKPHFGWKRIVSFTLFQKMHENAIFSPIRGGGRTPGTPRCWIRHCHQRSLKRKTHQRHCLCEVFFKTVTFLSRVAPAVAPYMLNWTSRRSSRWCVDSHGIVASFVRRRVPRRVLCVFCASVSSFRFIWVTLPMLWVYEIF